MKPNCPKHDEFRHLIGGQSNAEEAQFLTVHIETCPRCAETVQMMLNQDTLANRLTHSSVINLAEPIPSELFGKLIALNSASISANDETIGQAGKHHAIPDIANILSPPQASDELGRLGVYIVRQILGQGGMGIVFRAEDPRLQRDVALKVIRPTDADPTNSHKRFLSEARTVAKLKNDHIVTIYDIGESGGTVFVAMELLQGDSLGAALKSGTSFTISQILKMGRQIALGLAAAHEKGIIHRDVKPDNIWLEEPDHRIKLLDFGLARPLEREIHLTNEGMILGTPSYMAPEQANGHRVDARCDLFSLGCVLYRLLSGHLPFPGKNILETLNALATTVPPPLRSIRPDLPAEVDDLVLRLLSKNPDQRPASAQIVADEITAMECQLHPDTPTVTRRLRSRFLTALAICSLLAVVTLGAVMLIPTKNGILRIEVNDPDTEITLLKNNEVVIRKAKTEDIRITPTEHKFRVKRGDLEFETDNFVVKKGETVDIRIEFVEGKVQVVRGDRVLGKADVPVKIPETDFEKRIAALTAEQQVVEVVKELMRLNPTPITEVQSKIEDNVVTEFAFVARGGKDISPVRALRQLRKLTISELGITDLAPLKGIKLTFLELYYCENLYDITPLTGMPLESLNFWGVFLGSDLTPLKGMPLKLLNCGGNRQKVDLSPIADAPIVELYMNRLHVTDFRAIQKLPLTVLHCGGSNMEDLKILKGMKLLTLNIGQTEVSDLTPLQGMPLVNLSINGSKVTDLTPVKSLPLKTIWWDFKFQRDAAILREIKTLEFINGVPAAPQLIKGKGKK